MVRTVLIDPKLCIGCGNCVIACPGNASMGIDSKGGFGPRTEAALIIDEGGGVFLNEEVCIRSSSKPCKTCMDVCPAGAISYPEEYGFSSLERQVINRGICSGCGACVSACPEDAIEIESYPRLSGKCTNCGYCLLHCPRNPEENIDVFAFKMWDILGFIKSSLAIRAKKKAAGVQDGGFVTLLLEHLLERQVIDAAIVTGVEERHPWRAKPLLATSPEELYSSTGSKYTNSGCLQLLKKAKEKGYKRIAVVGLPCQIEGLLKLYTSPNEDLGYCKIIALSIGLFCKGNFYYKGIEKVIGKRTSLEDVVKLDIKGKYFRVETRRGSYSIPLKELLRFKREGCRYCSDFTSKLSDFSVGSLGSPGGYSTVFVRSTRAERMLNQLLSEDLVEARPIDGDNMKLIEKLAKSKVKQAIRPEGILPESRRVTSVGVSTPIL